MCYNKTPEGNDDEAFFDEHWDIFPGQVTKLKNNNLHENPQNWLWLFGPQSVAGSNLHTWSNWK